jgi:hypothetical protein
MSEAATPGGIPQAEFIVSVLSPSENSRRFALRSREPSFGSNPSPRVDSIISAGVHGADAAPEHPGGRGISPWLGNQEWVVGGGGGARAWFG